VNTTRGSAWIQMAFIAVLFCASTAHANAYREKGKVVDVANSSMKVTPPRDWNRLDIKPGKYAEVWTLDGEQLNDVTFFGGIEPGMPLVRERNKKRDPLPKFTASTLLIEVPELLERTYRAHKRIGSFVVVSSKPERFMGREGVHFSYEYTDQDNLTRKGEARAALVAKRLFMVTFDAPRLHYFDRTVSDFRALAETAELAN
jgi:hypothetical protein